jgi:hypothetical protein
MHPPTHTHQAVSGPAATVALGGSLGAWRQARCFLRAVFERLLLILLCTLLALLLVLALPAAFLGFFLAGAAVTSASEPESESISSASCGTQQQGVGQRGACHAPAPGRPLVLPGACGTSSCLGLCCCCCELDGLRSATVLLEASWQGGARLRPRPARQGALGGDGLNLGVFEVWVYYRCLGRRAAAALP